MSTILCKVARLAASSSDEDFTGTLPSFIYSANGPRIKFRNRLTFQRLGLILPLINHYLASIWNGSRLCSKIP